MFSFIHCADLHLGIMPEKNSIRFNDFFNAFLECINYATIKKVDFIIVAGDMFHQKVINSKTLSLTVNILKKAKENNIDVLVIEGNHDRAFYIDEESWLVYLDKEGLIKLLCVNNNSGSLSISKMVETDKYRVIGVGYLGGATNKYIEEIKKLLPIDKKPNILIMHAAIDKMINQNMGDIASEDIKKLEHNCIYIALGHVHTKYEINDLVYNPGSLENLRTKDELSGQKGFYYVQVDEKTHAKNVEYIESKRRPIRYKKIDCSIYKTPDDILSDLDNISSNWQINEGDIIYLALNGVITFNPILIDVKMIKEFYEKKYMPLYIELVNNINDSNQFTDASEGVNLEEIEQKAIEDRISYLSPDTKDISLTAKTMQNLALKLLNGELNKDIFDNLMRKEDL